MFETLQEQKKFCTEFNISEERFRNSRLSWTELKEIAEDFDKKRDEHLNTVKQYAEEIQKCSDVHSLSYRVKDTTHLIEKIIRKNVEYIKKGDSLSKENYEQKITDLMGIRVLLLFKSDWLNVHQHLMNLYSEMLLEPPFAHIRQGDDRGLYEGKVEIKDNKPYRSVHYVVKSTKGLGIEIQVRTLYEEAWSEIDHKLRYPYNLQDVMLGNYIDIMNRLTGIGDEMGSFINKYIRHFQESLFSGVSSDNEVYQYILTEIAKCDNEEVKNAIVDKIKQAENYREVQKMSDLLNQILKYEN